MTDPFHEPEINYLFFQNKNWTYSVGERVAVAKALVRVYETADDVGTFDGMTEAVRVYFSSMPSLLDEFGGL